MTAGGKVPADVIIPSGIPFTQFPNAAITDPRLDAYARSILLYLFMRANAQARAWPSQRTIAKDTGISRHKVGESLAALAEEGWLDVIESVNAPGTPVEHSQRHIYIVHGTRPVDTATPEPVPHTRGYPTRAGASQDRTGTREVPEPVPHTRHNNKQEQHPEQQTYLAKPKKAQNLPWEFLTDIAGPFGLPTETDRQRIRAGGLAKDIRATLEHHGIVEDDWPGILYRAASTWPLHFENATLTPDAFAKHLPALLRSPLKADQGTMNRLAEQAAISELKANEQKGLPRE